MAFEPKFEADLIWVIHNNIETIIKANEAAALRWANGGQAMEPFKEYRKSQWFNTKWPVLALIPTITAIDQAPDDSRCGVRHEFEVLIEDAGPNADAASESVIKRALAVDQILRKQRQAAILAGRDMAKVGAYSMEISRHEYFQVPRGTTMYLQLSNFSVTIELVESRR
jgi:hypothetical protein